MTDPLILIEHREAGVIRLTLNRPSSRNSLSADMLAALQTEIDRVRTDPHARVVILAGAGPAFCAGHDLKEIRAHDGDPEYAESLFTACSRVMQSLVTLPQPVIARVHGVATAAGLQLVASADLAIAADDARFATPGVNIGLFCSTPAVALGRAVARKHALELLLTGDLVDAAHALRIGLVNRVVPAADLDTAVDALAARIAGKSAAAIRGGKAAFLAQLEQPLPEAYASQGALMCAGLAGSDAREGIAAFLDKRQPRWTSS